MRSFLAGNIVGISLALLYFLASAFYSSKIVSSFKMMSVPLALGGFIARLALTGLIFYGLSKIKEIHFQAALITFALCFTACTIWKAARSLRSEGPLMKKPIER